MALPRIKKKYGLILAALLIIAVIAGGVVAKVNHAGPFKKKETPVVAGGTFNTKGEKKSSGKSDSSSSSDSKTSQGDKSGASGSGSSTQASSTVPLYTPTGNFVSNHRPNLGGQPAPNTLSSVCTTTPGASCKIVFTKDGVTKELPAHTADGNGSAFWNWKLQDVGLTAGAWKIEAVATLNGQTKSAPDALDLVVAQ